MVVKFRYVEMIWKIDVPKTYINILKSNMEFNQNFISGSGTRSTFCLIN